MRKLMGWAALAAVVLAAGVEARAQDGLNAFGGYPAGITTGSSYGFYPGGYRQGYAAYPTTSGYAVAPQTRYYSSGFYGGTPGTVTYSPGVNFSSANAAYYGYSTPLNPVYSAAPGVRYNYYRPGYVTAPGTYYRPGLFGGRSYYRW